MDEKIKFRLKTFFYYLVMEPWTEKFSFPNLGTIFWIMILIFLALRKPLLLWISIIIEILLYGIKEYKSGKYIHWYRQKRNEKLKKEKKEIPEAEEIIPNPEIIEELTKRDAKSYEP